MVMEKNPFYGSEKWILQGDVNTRFFHSLANGRRRKCTIFSLEDEGQEISDPVGIREHIENYYKNLFGSEVRGDMRLEENFLGK
jgi:hypothetical protein